MPTSNMEPSSEEVVATNWRTAPHPLTTPFTAGSDHTFTIADIGATHYAQEDTSLNPALWSLWPVSSGTELDAILEPAEPNE